MHAACVSYVVSQKNQRLKVDAKLACIRIRNWLVEVRRYSVCLSGDIANSRFL